MKTFTDYLAEASEDSGSDIGKLEKELEKLEKDMREAEELDDNQWKHGINSAMKKIKEKIKKLEKN